MLHVSDIQISKGAPRNSRNWHRVRAAGGLVRGLRGIDCGCRGYGVRAVAACQKHSPRFVDTGSVVAPGNRATTSSGPWYWAVFSAAGNRASCRCADRGGRRIALQGACCGGGRNIRRSACIEFYRNKAIGVAGRGYAGSLLVDPARGHSRSQRGTGPVARGIAAVCNQPRRYEGAGRSALAGRTVPVPRQAALHLGSTS